VSDPWEIVPGAGPEHPARFEAKFCRGEPDECWLWTADRASRYARLGVAGKMLYADIIAWALANGRWPEQGEVVRHACDTPKCVNPAHLSIGTHADNVADMVARGRHRHNPALDRGPATACGRGHDLTLPNARTKKPVTRKNPYGGECRECRNQLRREKNAARRAVVT
jgi:hypothetical protein